jgi:hypothetical protein
MSGFTMRIHRISGSEAFAYSDRRLSPAFGALRRFNGPRLRRFRNLRQAWPLLFPLAAVVGAMIGRGL